MEVQVYLNKIKMLLQKEARKIVLREIKKLSNIEIGILDEETIEFEYGWMFFYQSKEYIETGNLDKLVGGNAPIIFDKFESQLYVTGTGNSEDYYLEKFKDFKLNFKAL